MVLVVVLAEVGTDLTVNEFHNFHSFLIVFYCSFIDIIFSVTGFL